ncbi:sensor histidine kinase [Plantactinospora sp. CA-290183]|uniref:sensor histidine kinase n=1 Tax=Plantactinospora sp. CA-290183 TaxID=3240006 RepID=UPI003D8FB43A
MPDLTPLDARAVHRAVDPHLGFTTAPAQSNAGFPAGSASAGPPAGQPQAAPGYPGGPGPGHAAPAAGPAHAAPPGNGGPPGGQPPSDGGLRSRLVWMSAVPALLTALLGAATVSYLIATSPERVSDRTAVVLLVACVAGILVLAVAAARANRLGHWINGRIGALRSAAVQGRGDVQRLAEQLQRGERPAPPADLAPAAREDAFTLLARDLAQAQRAALTAVVRASTVRPSGNPTQQVEVFVNLSRRLQSLVHREIKLLDDLENQVEDPDLLKGLFQVDHLATRIRRHAENLAVLGGAVSRRQWSRPVALTEVLRSAIAEVEHYSRVKLVPPIEGTVRGHAVADVIHLVAELVENATNFAPPQTQVLLRAQVVTAGVAVEVEDRGLGMARGDQDRVNRLLANPDRIDIGELLRDGRIGLFVVSAIARRHGITVRLQANIYGGTQAILILPHPLLGTSTQGPDAFQQTQAQQTIQPARREPLSALTAEAAPPPVVSAPPPPAFTPRPAPLPAQVPTASAARSPYPGRAADTTQSVTRGGREPGYEPVISASPVSTGGLPSHRAPEPPARPQLPRRHRQTHLVPQLQQAPLAPPEDPAGEHDPGLMATFMRGVNRGEGRADDENGLAGRTDSDI